MATHFFGAGTVPGYRHLQKLVAGAETCTFFLVPVLLPVTSKVQVAITGTFRKGLVPVPMPVNLNYRGRCCCPLPAHFQRYRYLCPLSVTGTGGTGTGFGFFSPDPDVHFFWDFMIFYRFPSIRLFFFELACSFLCRSLKNWQYFCVHPFSLFLINKVLDHKLFSNVVAVGLWCVICFFGMLYTLCIIVRQIS